MKKAFIILFFLLVLCVLTFDFSYAQCSICTRTASQLGEQPAKGLNTGILYLMSTPFAIVGIIAYRWWKNNKD